jgi:predicted dehydrogenase
MTGDFKRRNFLGAAAGIMILKPALVRGTQRNSAVRMALFGCGGRGTGVAVSFTHATAAQYVALGDLFQEQTERAQAALSKAVAKAGKAPVAPQMLFHGPKSLDQLCESKDIDAIHIATPPFFHPEQLERCAGSGKHVYLEKPVAVDVPGCKRIMRAGEKMQGRASLAVGFQLRHATPYVQLLERAKGGDLGQIVCGLSHYYASALPMPKRDNVSPNERRLRNWLHDKVISGDILVEQNIHLVDLNNWFLGAVPLRAQGTGGRNGRQDPGDCYSHYNVTYTYPNDVHVTLTSTQFIQGAWDVAVRLFGTDGNAEMRYDAPVRITGRKPWNFPGLGPPGQVTDTAAAVAGAFKGALDDADAMRQRHFIDSITSGRFINEAKQGAESTLSAIMGRQAAYTGRTWSWEDTMKSNETWELKLDPARL